MSKENQMSEQRHTPVPWFRKGTQTATHQIVPMSSDPDAEPGVLMSLDDYDRVIQCVNAIAGEPDPAEFVARAKAASANYATLKSALRDEILRTSARPLGEMPLTSDGIPFGLNANLFVIDGLPAKVFPVGVLSISDPDDRHRDDYPEGQRWNVLTRGPDGVEVEYHEGDLFSTEAAALSTPGDKA